MVDGSTDLTPNKRREYWYKEIIDAQGGGGGGGYDAVIEFDDEYNISIKSGAFVDCYGKTPLNIGVAYPAGETGIVLYVGYSDENGTQTIYITVSNGLSLEENGAVIVDTDYTFNLVWTSNGITFAE